MNANDKMLKPFRFNEYLMRTWGVARVTFGRLDRRLAGSAQGPGWESRFAPSQTGELPIQHEKVNEAQNAWTPPMARSKHTRRYFNRRESYKKPLKPHERRKR